MDKIETKYKFYSVGSGKLHFVQLITRLVYKVSCFLFTYERMAYMHILICAVLIINCLHVKLFEI